MKDLRAVTFQKMGSSEIVEIYQLDIGKQRIRLLYLRLL